MEQKGPPGFIGPRRPSNARHIHAA